jgi:hypothetical protein
LQDSFRFGENHDLLMVWPFAYMAAFNAVVPV